MAVERKHKHFRRLLALTHSSQRGTMKHETQLLVLSGFALTVIHMNVSSNNPKIPKEIMFTNWRRHCVAAIVEVVIIVVVDGDGDDDAVPKFFDVFDAEKLCTQNQPRYCRRGDNIIKRNKTFSYWKLCH